MEARSTNQRTVKRVQTTFKGVRLAVIESELTWVPITVGGEDGSQTFLTVDGLLCRAVCIPSRRNLFLTVDVKRPIPQHKVEEMQKDLSTKHLPITISPPGAGGPKLLFRYTTDECTEKEVRLLLSLAKSLLE